MDPLTLVTMALYIVGQVFQQAKGAEDTSTHLRKAYVVFDPSACTLEEGDYDAFPPGYSGDCSGEEGPGRRDYCPCQPGSHMVKYSRCSHCIAHRDCSGRVVKFEGNSTKDRECGDWIVETTTEQGVLPEQSPPQKVTGTTVLPQEASTSTSAMTPSESQVATDEDDARRSTWFYIAIAALVPGNIILMLVMLGRFFPKKVKHMQMLLCQRRSRDRGRDVEMGLPLRPEPEQ